MSLQLIVQFLVLTTVVSGVLIFFLKKILFDSTQGAVNRLNRETEEVRKKQTELNEKIKLANEELVKRRSEADDLVAKMKLDAEEKATAEREKILNKARADAEEIITKAQNTKDDMRKALEKEMRLKAIDYSVLVLDDILMEKAKAAFNETLIEDFIESLEKVDMGMITGETAEVIVSLPLGDRLKTALKDNIKGKLGRDVQLNISEDKSIISGIVLRFGSLSLDGSLRNMMAEKGVEIKERLEKGLMQ